MINKELIGKKIQQARINQKMTQEQLAEAVEISSNYLSKVERGLNMPAGDTLLKIIELLQLELEDFSIHTNPLVNKERKELNYILTNCNNKTISLILAITKTIIAQNKNNIL